MQWGWREVKLKNMVVKGLTRVMVVRRREGTQTRKLSEM